MMRDLEASFDALRSLVRDIESEWTSKAGKGSAEVVLGRTTVTGNEEWVVAMMKNVSGRDDSGLYFVINSFELGVGD
jgi:hypothetical protein